MPGTPAGFQARVDKHLFDKIRLPTLIFSWPTLPYVTVAHLPTVVHWYQHRVSRDNLIAHHYNFIDKLLPGATVRDQCMACVALFNKADLTEVGRLYGC